MKHVLMVAFHFPPAHGSSGVQRTLRFARYLGEFGWKATVLTAHPRAHEQLTGDQLADIPPNVAVHRAQAWDAARHFAIAGRYPASLARPDRWRSWWLGGVPCGLRLIRTVHPDVLWSTYPIATAHRIAVTLARASGLPLVADFRDPMAQPGYPPDPATWKVFERIERETILQAAASMFTTPSALRTYRSRYPERAQSMELLENGYDEATFEGIAAHGPLDPDRLTLLHSGIVYPDSRDPSCLFDALRRLRQSHPDLYRRIRVRFRAPVHDDLLWQLASRNDVTDALEIMPAVGYRDALSEMLRADGLLLLQASDCNEQVPAKLYEYLRAGRPVVTLTDPAGDTASVARNAGLDALAPLDDAAAIHALLVRFMQSPRAGTLPSPQAVAGASRRGRTASLAKTLERVVVQRPAS